MKACLINVNSAYVLKMLFLSGTIFFRLHPQANLYRPSTYRNTSFTSSGVQLFNCPNKISAVILCIAKSATLCPFCPEQIAYKHLKNIDTFKVKEKHVKFMNVFLQEIYV